jgi:hypothetical protein
MEAFMQKLVKQIVANATTTSAKGQGEKPVRYYSV